MAGRQALQFEYRQTADHWPLCIVRNFPGLDAEMKPEELRDMARQLQQAANETETKITTTTVKFEPMECVRCGVLDIECTCEVNSRSLKNQTAYYKRVGYAEVEMSAERPNEVLRFLLSQAAARIDLPVHLTKALTIYHWLSLDLHLECGVWAAGNGYEWFVMEKLQDGSYQLDSSNMSYGSAPYALKTVLQRLDGRGGL
jgi:hypothetical protein